jgi:photolyase PhrII
MLPDILSKLPVHLRERCHLPEPDRHAADGSFVLYWMHHAVRADENPALDAACSLAILTEKPLLVYQGLAGRHPYNNDRHHTFILEGGRDVHEALAERGIRHVFHLATDPAVPGPLRELISQASMVVTEDYPAPPFPVWQRALMANCNNPWILVDTSCIVPMRSIGKGYSRAYHFRNRMGDEAMGRAPVDWPAFADQAMAWEGDVRGDVDWSTPIADLVAGCRIDHAVGPVPHTRGGTTAAMQRWEHFLATGMKGYARKRNSPTAENGVSRMSPYLHYGHISPFKVARDAARHGSSGAEKFLDELLIWRELAFNLCLHNNDVESVSILPEWARTTLLDHSKDDRPALYDWEQLARSQTEDPLWNAAQTSLLVHGELHNNVRMTWGKAVLAWTRSPQEALDMLIDLNHRYALDGSDPNSYGGILWCLGMLDRPFYPERPMLGTVRPRSSKRHAQRVDMPVYERSVSRPARGSALRIGVIGAGPAGLMAARTLADHGMEVTVFDKGRGPGGRISTRLFDGGAVDHGAPFLRFTDERLKPWAQAWARRGLISRFKARIHPLSDASDFEDQWTGVPDMRALARFLAENASIHQSVRIERLRSSEEGWYLIAEDERAFGPFDEVIIATPARQASALLSGVSPRLLQSLTSVDMQPVWTTLLAFDAPLDIDWDAGSRLSEVLNLVIRNNAKSRRKGAESWALHASHDWSTTHLERSADDIARDLIAAFSELIGDSLPTPIFEKAHRWRFARTSHGAAEECLRDNDLKLTACGDWATCGRDDLSHACGIETALLSGQAAAGRVLGSATLASPVPGLQKTLFALEEPA